MSEVVKQMIVINESRLKEMKTQRDLLNTSIERIEATLAEDMAKLKEIPQEEKKDE